MSGVVFGRSWKIVSSDHFEDAMEILKDDEFIANMSDSYAVTRSELAEINRQREDVLRQAKENGIKRFKVYYGVSISINHLEFFDDPEKAIEFAEQMVHYPHGYSFAYAYDIMAKGECKLMWDHNRGRIKEYVG